jgi:hypothetical protein
MVPGLTNSTVVGLVAEVLRSVEPVAEERSLNNRMLLIGNSGGGKDTETKDGDGGDALSGDVHRGQYRE